MQDNYAIHIWRLLRSPFTLSEGTHDKCSWELIDLGLIGCTVCGYVHVCHRDTCKTVGMEYGEVCVITGVAVKTTYFPEDEYMETINLEASKRNPNLFNENDHHAIVENSVYEILTSNQARTVHAAQILKRIEKGLVMMRTSGLHLMQKAPLCCSSFELYKCVDFFDLKGRKVLAEKCFQHQLYTLTLMVREFGMSLRVNEIRSVVFGMLYLMRFGVYVEGVCVLQKFEELNSLLPSESFLQKCVGLKPKLITDTENRIKFCLRNIDKEKLEARGFALSRSI